MSQVKVSGNASGSGTLTIAAPVTNSDYTLTLPTANGTVQVSGNPISGTTATFSGAASVGGDMSFNSGYGSAAVAYGCRAWVNFNGVAAGTFAGGTSTVTRVAGSTTATVTTTTAHGMVTGNVVYAATGVVAGTYTITVLSSTTFSFTTVATTALTAASITFNVATISAAGNVNSVAKNGTGDYTVNFTTAMPDGNYSIFGTTNNSVSTVGTSGFQGVMQDSTNAPTTSAVRIRTIRSTVAFVDLTLVCVSIFR